MNKTNYLVIDINSGVFLYHKNKVCKGKVTKSSVNTSSGIIEYSISFLDGNIINNVSSDLIFETKEDLKAHLLSLFEE